MEDSISRQAARMKAYTASRKSVEVIDSKPSANKKGLRIKVESVELDENNNLLTLHIDFSGLHIRGGGIVEVSQRNKFDLPEE